MSPLATPSATSTPSSAKTRLVSAARVAWTHVLRHSGVGIICSVAYFDPGNWSVDLQAGSDFGFKLLFIVLLSGLFAVFLQSLACKLGVVTGMDLAAHCRLLLYNRTKRPKLFRWLTLYPLYVFSEIAIISTDLAELLGSAIALNIIFPKLPLWAGVLLTASDVFVILILGDPLRNRPVKLFEVLIGVLVITVLISMCVIISRVSVDWGEAFLGFVPSKTIFQAGGLYTSVGIIGATVMPHSIFLGSSLATQERTGELPTLEDEKTSFRSPSSSEDSLDGKKYEKESIRSALASYRRMDVRGVIKGVFGYKPSLTPEPTSHAERENNSLQFVRAHLFHGVVNLAISLLGIAVAINALILILAGAVFRDSAEATSSLFDAADLIGSTIGHPMAIVFALALLCAGQSASIVATVAGQIVSEGFLRWRVSPVFRRMLTRLLGLIPSMVVAVAAGRDGIDTMLVASQVILSIVLPFIVFPLVWLTSSKTVMRVRKSISAGETQIGTAFSRTFSIESQRVEGVTSEEFVDFSNGWPTIIIASTIWLLIVLANFYVIIELILGKSG